MAIVIALEIHKWEKYEKKVKNVYLSGRGDAVLETAQFQSVGAKIWLENWAGEWEPAGGH